MRCAGKVGHDTWKQAAAAAMRTSHMGRLHVYKCKHCKKYHVGHTHCGKAEKVLRILDGIFKDQ
jgi:hypothetical protein